MKKTKIKTHRPRKPVTAIRESRNKPCSSGGKKASPGLKRATLERMVGTFLESRHQLAPAVITINFGALTRFLESFPPSDNDHVLRISRDAAMRNAREFCLPSDPDNTAHADSKGSRQT